VNLTSCIQQLYGSFTYQRPTATLPSLCHVNDLRLRDRGGDDDDGDDDDDGVRHLWSNKCASPAGVSAMGRDQRNSPLKCCASDRVQTNLANRLVSDTTMAQTQPVSCAIGQKLHCYID